MMTTFGQTHYDEYSCELPDGIETRDAQWHYDQVSVVGTSEVGLYLALDSYGRSALIELPSPDVIYKRIPYGVMVDGYYPYIKGSSGYWYVVTNRGSYLVSKYGSWSKVTIKYYTSYRYTIPRGRWFYYYDWHLCPRHRVSYYKNIYHRRVYSRRSAPIRRPTPSRVVAPRRDNSSSYRSSSSSSRGSSNLRTTSPSNSSYRSSSSRSSQATPLVRSSSSSNRSSHSSGSSRSSRSSGSSRSSSSSNSSYRR